MISHTTCRKGLPLTLMAAVRPRVRRLCTYVDDGAPLSPQHAPERRPAGQHAAEQVGVEDRHHVLWPGPQ